MVMNDSTDDVDDGLTPVERAAAVYGREACARSFREDLEAHLLHGLVFSTPTAFCMARYVSREWPGGMIVDPHVNDSGVAGGGVENFGESDLTCALKNCIHLYLAAGDMGEFFEFPHEPCEWISYERNNVLRFHSYEALKKRCTKNLTARISPPI